MARSLFVLCWVLLGIAGCGPVSVVSQGTTVDGVAFEIHSPDSKVQELEESGVFRSKSKGLEVEIREGALTVNGKAFGTAKRGEKVKVTREGRVFVNDVERQPQ